MNLRATTRRPSGIFKNLGSFVTVPTTATMRLNLLVPSGTTVLSLDKCLAMRDNERG